MTHEEVKAAIERLRSMKTADRDFIVDVCRAFLGDCEVTGDELHYTLIELLEQADPDTYMELPISADGVPIHIGDELCGYGYPNGGVHCYAIVNERTILVQGDPSAYKDWLLWDAANCRHHHKPTVEDVLRDFVNRVMSYNEDEDDGDAIISDYAAKLRELMADD